MDLKRKTKELGKKLGRNFNMDFMASMYEAIKEGYEEKLDGKSILDKCKSWEDLFEMIYMTCGNDLMCQAFIDLFQMVLSLEVEFTVRRAKIFLNALHFIGNKYIVLSG